MAVHTVPQDVETDDKILGPFTTRQFIYLLIAAAFCGVGYVLAQIFIGLIVIVIPPILFLLLLALPIKKDQPMETFLAAKISFLFRNNRRIWMPGQSNTTVEIMVPKQQEPERAKNLGSEEVTRRLSFLADIVDTEGYAIKGSNPNLPLNQEVYAEAEGIKDMYEQDASKQVSQDLEQQSTAQRQNLIDKLRNAVGAKTQVQATDVTEAPTVEITSTKVSTNLANSSFVNPYANTIGPKTQTQAEIQAAAEANVKEEDKNPVIVAPKLDLLPTPEQIDLANNKNFSVDTIAKQANRIAEKNEKDKPNDEVYISLH